MYSATALISASESFAATTRIILFGSFARSPLRNDISCALESHEAIGCRGYTQQDAARIGLNVLLYSLNQ